MPRRSSGPKLWFDKSRGTWTIVDGRRRSRTGFTEAEISDAEGALADYIGAKHEIKDSPVPRIADVLAFYATEHVAHKISAKSILWDIGQLAKWWGDKLLTEVTTKNCRAYAASRDMKPSARRELTFLGTAIRYWHKEKFPLKFIPTITLPPKPESRTHFMTRDEAARFLWVARRTPHLARFFIIGWYTGSRRTVITGLKWSMVDLKTQVMKRKPFGAIETKKRAPPVRMGSRLMAHMRRWRRMDGDAEFVIHFQGQKIFRPDRAWERARRLAKLPDYVTPHILRHSRATHMMKQRVDPWDAANALGMSLEMLTKVYGHHHPDWQKDASETR